MSELQYVKGNDDLRYGVYVLDKSGGILVTVEGKEKIAIAVTP